MRSCSRLTPGRAIMRACRQCGRRHPHRARLHSPAARVAGPRVDLQRGRSTVSAGCVEGMLTTTRAPPPPRTQCRDLANIAFRFKEKERPAGYVVSLAGQLHVRQHLRAGNASRPYSANGLRGGAPVARGVNAHKVVPAVGGAHRLAPLLRIRPVRDPPAPGPAPARPIRVRCSASLWSAATFD